MSFNQSPNIPANLQPHPSPTNGNSTKLYVIIDSNTPITMRVSMPPSTITLRQFKEITSLHDRCFKFYFKAEDSEFGIVKEEVTEDSSPLPYDNENKIVAWIITDRVNQSFLFDNTLCSPTSSKPKPLDYKPPQPLSSPPQQSRIMPWSQPATPTGPAPPPLPPKNHDMQRLPPVPFFGDNSDSKPMPATPQRAILSGTHSLPRSITPRSFYAQNNFANSIDNCNSSVYTYPRYDSRSVYETPTYPFGSVSQPNVVLHCTRDSIEAVYAALKKDIKSLDVRDREWLRVVIKDAFLGSSLVDWLGRNVYGFGNRRDIKQYANQLLRLGLIKDPVATGSFSERCYYKLN